MLIYVVGLFAVASFGVEWVAVWVVVASFASDQLE